MAQQNSLGALDSPQYGDVLVVFSFQVDLDRRRLSVLLRPAQQIQRRVADGRRGFIVDFRVTGIEHPRPDDVFVGGGNLGHFRRHALAVTAVQRRSQGDGIDGVVQRRQDPAYAHDDSLRHGLGLHLLLLAVRLALLFQVPVVSEIAANADDDEQKKNYQGKLETGRAFVRRAARSFICSG